MPCSRNNKVWKQISSSSTSSSAYAPGRRPTSRRHPNPVAVCSSSMSGAACARQHEIEGHASRRCLTLDVKSSSRVGAVRTCTRGVLQHHDLCLCIQQEVGRGHERHGRSSLLGFRQSSDGRHCSFSKRESKFLSSCCDGSRRPDSSACPVTCARKLPSGADPTTYGATINACEERKFWQPPPHENSAQSPAGECVSVSACSCHGRRSTGSWLCTF